jgi:hypothetical protein
MVTRRRRPKARTRRKTAATKPRRGKAVARRREVKGNPFRPVRAPFDALTARDWQFLRGAAREMAEMDSGHGELPYEDVMTSVGYVGLEVDENGKGAVSIRGKTLAESDWPRATRKTLANGRKAPRRTRRNTATTPKAKRAKKGGRLSMWTGRPLKKQHKYMMTLGSMANPDFGQTRRPAAGRTVHGDTLREMVDKARAYRDRNELGGGNWIDPVIIDAEEGEPVGRISYNGRLWTMGPWQTATEIMV